MTTAVKSSPWGKPRAKAWMSSHNCSQMRCARLCRAAARESDRRPSSPNSVVCELKSTLAACTYDASSGVLAPMQIVSTVSPDFKGRSAAAEVIVAPSGQFLYTATRWADVLTVYSIDQLTGQVTSIDWISAGVRTPREFAMDPTGSYVYAMGLDSDTINTFAVDAASGKLTPTGQLVNANSPVCMVFGKV